MSLTDRQNEIMNGLMLGDGYLGIGKNCKNPRLRINRSKKDIEYAKWIDHEFSSYCSSKSLLESIIFDSRYNKAYERVSFNTRRHPDFMEQFNSWYKNGLKIVPEELELTPLTIAVWFADDGCIYQKFKNGSTNGFEISFATCSFSKEENLRLKDMLENIYDPGLQVYGEYNESRNDYKIKGSTRVASRIIKSFDTSFPPMNRKSKMWRGGPLDLNRFVICKFCNKDSVFKNGFYYSRSGTKLAQKFKCNGCNNRWKVKL